MERPGFFKQVRNDIALKRTPLQWAKFVLFFALAWLLMVGLIIAMSFWIPQTRTGWILLIVLGPPAWALIEFLMYLLKKTRLYQAAAAIIGGMSSPTRIFLMVILFLCLILSGYAAFTAFAWIASEL